jgi:phosphate/sulfate permease
MYLLPVESLIPTYHAGCDGGCAPLAAIIWNIGTWYYGIPASSRTPSGSIPGVAAASRFQGCPSSALVNWSKAGETALPCSGQLASPTIGMMFQTLRAQQGHFHELHKRKSPASDLVVAHHHLHAAELFPRFERSASKGIIMLDSHRHRLLRPRRG